MEDSVSVDGINIAYENEGNGEALILIHGLGVSRRVWDMVIPGLSKYYCVYALDLPGFGRSDKPDIDYCVEYYADIVKKFLAALNIEKASVAGCSMGGAIAAAFAGKYPANVDRLILMDAAGLTPIGNGKRSALSKKIIAGMLRLQSLSKNSFKKSASEAFYDKRHVDGPAMEDMWLILKDPASRSAMMNNLLSLMTVDESYVNIVRSILAPALIVWGKEDRSAPLADADRYNEMIKGSQVRIYEKCGHLPMIEKPEELVKDILGFLGEEDIYYPAEEQGDKPGQPQSTF